MKRLVFIVTAAVAICLTACAQKSSNKQQEVNFRLQEQLKQLLRNWLR